MTEIKTDKRFERHPASIEIFLKVKRALRDFPEVKKVTLTACRGLTVKSLCRPMQNNTISFNVRTIPTNQTIYRELFRISTKK
ncbi:MAG: hypothetical protein M0R51_08500 [Clostridia bacterium]|jgi:hypothetical protein|nr:hypothetical protein [Clostridia bacterium]